MFSIPPYPKAIVEMLRNRGHEVAVRQQKSGSLRYRVDANREWTALQMSRFYERQYEGRQ